MSENEFDVEVISTDAVNTKVLIDGKDVSSLLQSVSYEGRAGKLPILNICFAGTERIHIKGPMEVTAIGDKSVSRAWVEVDPDGDKEIPLKSIVIKGRDYYEAEEAT